MHLKKSTSIKLFPIIGLISFSVLLFSCNQTKDNLPAIEQPVVDDLGVFHSFEKEPQSIITLAPNLTEMVYALNLQKKLIGNTTYCNYPEEAKNITHVGDLLTVDYESITMLKPGLIFITVEGNQQDTYQKLKDLGFRAFVSNPRDYEGVKKTLSGIGKIFNIEDRVVEIISRWDVRINRVVKLAESKPSQTAMFLVSVKPIMLAGPNTFINEFLEKCNLKNIALGESANYPFYSREEVLKKNPDIIFHTIHNYSRVENIESAYSEWSGLTAVKNGAVYYLDPDLFFRPGPRFVDAVENLFFTLYPGEK